MGFSFKLPKVKMPSLSLNSIKKSLPSAKDLKKAVTPLPFRKDVQTAAKKIVPSKDQVKDFFTPVVLKKPVVDAIKDAGETAIEGIGDIGDNIVDAVEEVPGMLGNAAGDAIGGMFSGIFGDFNLSRTLMIGGGAFAAYKIVSWKMNKPAPAPAPQ